MKGRLKYSAIEQNCLTRARERKVLEAGLTAEGGEQLPCQIGGVGRIPKIFPTDMVVENASLRCPMDMRKREVHAIALNRPGDSANKDHRTVRLLPLNDSHVGQGIIDEPVTVVIPSIVEEDEISRTSDGSLVHFAMPPNVMLDEPDSVGF